MAIFYFSDVLRKVGLDPSKVTDRSWISRVL